MLKIGDTVTHLYDNPEAPLGEDRIVHMRKGTVSCWSGGRQHSVLSMRLVR